MFKSKLSFFLLTALSILLGSCASDSNSSRNHQQEEKANDRKVPYAEARNYFVKNNYQTDELHHLKISTQSEFDNIFGMATTMGPDGQPTPIDFDKQFVIALIGQTSDKAPTLQIKNLEKKSQTLVVNYSLTEDEKQSYTIRPLQILIVDQQYEGPVEILQQ